MNGSNGSVTEGRAVGEGADRDTRGRVCSPNPPSLRDYEWNRNFPCEFWRAG